MEGEVILDHWLKFGNNKVAEAAMKFEKYHLQKQPDEFFGADYQQWNSKLASMA
jgi:hypothetical protein